MRKSHLLLSVLAALLVAGAQGQDKDMSREKTQEAAAMQGLAMLRVLTPENARELGLSTADAARATLGTPLPIYSVDLAVLRNFRPGADAAALIKPSAAAFYPVLLDGGVRSSVRVERGNTGWEAARVGNAGVATAIDRARRALPAPDAATTSLVQVLALNLLFVAQQDASGWLLAPVVDDASAGLTVGKAEPAANVLARLAPIAARHNGEPT